MTVRVYIGLGSNLEDPVAQVLEAVEELEMIPDSIHVGRSSLYRGKPMGPADQPDYVNAVVAMDTLLSPADFLKELTKIEDLQGRARDGEKWGSENYRSGPVDVRQAKDQYAGSDGAASRHARARLRYYSVIGAGRGRQYSRPWTFDLID